MYLRNAAKVKGWSIKAIKWLKLRMLHTKITIFIHIIQSENGNEICVQRKHKSEGKLTRNSNSFIFFYKSRAYLKDPDKSKKMIIEETYGHLDFSLSKYA